MKTIVTLLLVFCGCDGVLAPNESQPKIITDCAGITGCESDGCCPVGCDATTDADCSLSCGNGTVDALESCDGNCPTSCDDGNSCTIESLEGAASNCTAVCVSEAITTCIAGDGCCAPGCTEETDSDCAPGCGNGRIEGNELCDGDCSPDCDDGSSCTQDSMRGSPATCDVVCEYVSTGSCQNGDGCCPDGCSPINDDDCAIDCTDPSTWPNDWSAFETTVVEGLNAARAQGADCGEFGVFAPAGPLALDSNLQQAARCHSDDMATNNFFDHVGSDNSSFSQRAQGAGFQGQPVGENIAAGQSSPMGAVAGWVDSDGHCRILMNPNANRVGIGYVTRTGTEWTRYWTMVTGVQ